MKRTRLRVLSIFVAVCMLLSMNASSLTAFAAVDTNQAVWVYHAGSTEPYATYDTITNSVFTNTSFKANDIIELHGDITTTATVSVSKKVTIRSEADEDHSWSINVGSTSAALKMAEGGVLTIGGGSGYGTITADMNGSGIFLLMNIGTAYIEDGIIIKNANYANEGAAIRMYASSNNQYLHVNGGVFQNNTAARGGAIYIGNSYSTAYINGGTFIDNTATGTVDGTVSPFGNAIFNSGKLYVGGSPIFGENQEVYLYDINANASSITYSNSRPMIKEAELTTVIPVRLGYKPASIYEGRNILESGTAAVSESDLQKIKLLNGSEQYKKLDFTEKDSNTKKPVLELVPSFTENYANFIDDDYINPADEGGSRSKTARWLNGDKSQAEIIINEKSNEPGSKVLVLSSLCGAHSNRYSTIKKVVDLAAQDHDVDYLLESMTCGGPSQFDNNIAGKLRGPYKGTVNKGGELKVTGIETGLYSGAHNAGNYFATYLQEKLQTEKYGTIIMIFDNAAINSYMLKPYTLEEQAAFYQAANLLKSYYDNDQVVWVTSGTHITCVDYDTSESLTVEATDELLVKGAYSTDESKYHYESSSVSKTLAGKYDKFCAFFTMALMDPETWLEGVEDNRIPEWKKYSLNTNGVSYKEAEDIEQYFDALFKRDEVVIRDKVDSDLPINSVYFEISNDSGTTWQTITDDPLITIERDGQEVCCTMKNTAYLYTDMRLRIVCDCPGEFCTEGQTAKDTNVGNATITYKYEDNEVITNKLKSPQLIKVSDYSISVSKTFKGLTQDQIDELDSNDYLIKVTNNSITPVETKKLALSEKEGAIAPDSKTINGNDITYTWSIPKWWEGQYDIEEENAEVTGYSFTTKVNGIDADETESGTMKIEGIDISEEDSSNDPPSIDLITEGNAIEGLVIKITDDIKDTGNLVASIEDGDVPEGYHFEWFKTIDGSKWMRISKITYSNGVSNITGDDSECVNVALTGGARTETTMTTYRAVLTADNAVPSADAVPKDEFVQSKYYDRIMNGGFEDVQIPNGTNWCNPSSHLQLMISSDRTNEQIESVIDSRYGYSLGYIRIEDSLIWKTTASDGVIELVNASPEKSGAEGNYQACAMDAYFNTVAPVHSSTNNVTYEGDQMVELNASEVSSLYQDVLTVPGTKLYWSFMHRARQNSGENRMKVVIMNTKQAEELLASSKFASPQAAVEYVYNHPSEFPGAVVSDDLGATVSEWTNHSGTYEVPEGQALTRLFFVSTSSSSQGIGNLIDDVTLSTDMPVPESSQATVVINKEIQGNLGTDEVSSLIQKLKINYSYIDGEGELVERTIGTGEGEQEFSWSASDQGKVSVTFDVPEGESVEFTVSEDLESASMPNHSHHVKYSAETNRGGKEINTYRYGTYRIAMKGGEVATVNITNEYNGVIDIENKYELSNCDLTIIKNVVGDMDDEDQRFRFHVTGTPETATKDVDMYVAAMKVEGEKSYSVTICDLPAGKYTVTEDTDWSWRYKPDECTKEITISPKEPDKNKVEFNNTLENKYWLSGTSYAVNNKAGRVDQIISGLRRITG